MDADGGRQQTDSETGKPSLCLAFLQACLTSLPFQSSRFLKRSPPPARRAADPPPALEPSLKKNSGSDPGLGKLPNAALRRMCMFRHQLVALLFAVTDALPASRQSPLHASSTPSDSSCKSISSMATHDWCAINCADGVCPPQTCRCGDALKARVDPQAAHVSSSLPLKLADVDASTCVAVSPSATSYWCQLKCSNGGHCPEHMCRCEKAAVSEEGNNVPEARPAQPTPWWRANKKRDEAGPEEAEPVAPDEAEPEVAPDEAEPAPDPALQPKQQPSWSRTAQPTAWWKNEAEPAESVEPATAEIEGDGGCPSYVSRAGEVKSAFSQVDDSWCDSNCRGGNCPEDKCMCSTDADARAPEVLPSPSAHPAQPTPWWRANKKKSNDESGAAQQKPPKQQKPWWKDCGDKDCDGQQSAKVKTSVHPKQPEAWWKHDGEQKEQQAPEQGMEGYMYPGESNWKDTAEIYKEGADDDYEAKLEPTIEPKVRGKTAKHRR